MFSAETGFSFDNVSKPCRAAGTTLDNPVA